MILGLEETAVLDLAAPPGGAEVVSVLGDIGGFRHDDVDEVPDRIHPALLHQHQQPRLRRGQPVGDGAGGQL
jgi:hypothetical protein